MCDSIEVCDNWCLFSKVCKGMNSFCYLLGYFGLFIYYYYYLICCSIMFGVAGIKSIYDVISVLYKDDSVCKWTWRKLVYCLIPISVISQFVTCMRYVDFLFRCFCIVYFNGYCVSLVKQEFIFQILMSVANCIIVLLYCYYMVV
jgi:hypothetical protein